MLARLRGHAAPGAGREFVLRLSCPDSRGVVYAVSRALYEAGCNIVDAQQFSAHDEPATRGRFFMRVHLDAPGAAPEPGAIARLLDGLREAYDMRIEVHDAAWRPRAAILVSREGHCLNDLMFRQSIGQLPVEIAVVISNHEDLREMAERSGFDFHHLPLAAAEGGKPAQEARLLALLERERVELVVLARYMQILSPELCARLRGRAINIHHSFLPSFKGAQPYRQAHARGVKLIGATAHYVTSDLDEGPIIEQDVERVDHAAGPRELAAIGRDIECVVLARALKWHCEHRVLMNGARTVVFR
ncbi:MAG: formyltetrahydrofolate deformylase [Burkholderia sp.]